MNRQGTCVRCGKYFIGGDNPYLCEDCKKEESMIEIRKNSKFYINCVRQRRAEAKICQDCPFRQYIEEQERKWKDENI